MIRFEQVEKSFAGHPVLRDFSCVVPEGATVALLGLSGSGKTTALKLVCGLHWAERGRIFLNGQEVKRESILSIRRQLGYVIQDGGLFPHLTAIGNLALVAREAGWSEARTTERVNELVALTKLRPSLLDQYPRALSGGQRQRIGLIRALLLDPPVLLLDEPMGALDPITRAELQIELKDLFHSLKKTVLLVTHDLFEAGYLASHILLLHEGRIAQRGSMRELVEQPADDFVQRFVRSQRLGEA